MDAPKETYNFIEKRPALRKRRSVAKIKAMKLSASGSSRNASPGAPSSRTQKLYWPINAQSPSNTAWNDLLSLWATDPEGKPQKVPGPSRCKPYIGRKRRVRERGRGVQRGGERIEREGEECGERGRGVEIGGQGVERAGQVVERR